MITKIFDKIMDKAGRKRIILDRDNKSEYMIRYYIWRKRDEDNKKSNLFIHKIMRSDSDNHLHNHPWKWATFLIKGSYIEILPDNDFFVNHKKEELDIWGDIPFTYKRKRKWLTFRRNHAKDYHQLKLINDKPVWTIFWHGKRHQDWSFYVEGQPVQWKEYLDGRN